MQSAAAGSNALARIAVLLTGCWAHHRGDAQDIRRGAGMIGAIWLGLLGGAVVLTVWAILTTWVSKMHIMSHCMI
jgi:uncharacterized membrane protein YfcA